MPLAEVNAMGKQAGLQTLMSREIADFEKSMEELRLLRMITQDLRKAKRMIKIKKFD